MSLETEYKSTFPLIAKNGYQMSAYESFIKFSSELEKQYTDKGANEIGVFAPNYTQYEHIKAYRLVEKYIDENKCETAEDVKKLINVLITSILS